MRRRVVFPAFVLAASVLATTFPAAAADPKPAPPLRAMAALPTVAPLSDGQLAQIRGQGWADTLAALIASCGGSCNIQSVRQVNTDPNGSNVSVIQQSQ